MKFTLLVLLALSSSFVISFAPAAHAAGSVVVDETLSRKINSIDDAFWYCRPGQASNGHNFPTESSVTLGYIEEVVPDTNSEDMYYNDPQSREGDHCAELKKEFSALLPADFKVRRVVTRGPTESAGTCLDMFVETLSGSIGGLRVDGGSSFVVGPAPAADCPSQGNL